MSKTKSFLSALLAFGLLAAQATGDEVTNHDPLLGFHHSLTLESQNGQLMTGFLGTAIQRNEPQTSLSIAIVETPSGDQVAFIDRFDTAKGVWLSRIDSWSILSAFLHDLGRWSLDHDGTVVTRRLRGSFGWNSSLQVQGELVDDSSYFRASLGENWGALARDTPLAVRAAAQALRSIHLADGTEGDRWLPGFRLRQFVFADGLEGDDPAADRWTLKIGQLEKGWNSSRYGPLVARFGVLAPIPFDARPVD
jgi:hypothetical protein